MQPSHPNRSVAPRERLATARLYLCTDARRDKGDLAFFAEEALAGGVDIIQLRDKGSPGEARFGPLKAEAELGALADLKAAARRHGALVAVNDRADIALAAGADVLHLGQNDLPPGYARAIVGPDVVIGRSTHNRAQAGLAAVDDHIDYFCTGPVWTTPTKPGRAAAGVDLVRSTAESHPTRPWFAIGGVDEQRLDEIFAAGADRVVVVRAITEARDPQAAARSLKQRLLESAAG
ncbi:thiamine phosphate synthase [Nocardia sp. NPDC051570]|uniref:thiamine phosphate synthase n=1 Tax=Nocardia sp. NPDC051570 TaxID=3364324 RepID=UPI00378BD589